MNGTNDNYHHPQSQTPVGENSNRHKLMNNRLKTLIQNRQSQKDQNIGQQQPQPSTPTQLPGQQPQFSSKF